MYKLFPQGAKNSQMVFLAAISALVMFALASCNSTTVLLANFNNDNVGSPPGATQSTGTVSLNPGAGSITVVNAPRPGLPANKWASISHPNTPSPETTLTGRFSQFFNTGKYGLLASVHIPSGAEVVTVQLESFNQTASFMHLDFMPQGDVRIDDSNVRFGHFPRDTNFVLSMNLNIYQDTSIVEISLMGSGASGNITITVQHLFQPVARQFGAVKFWVGYQWRASFFVDDILVTRKN